MKGIKVDKKRKKSGFEDQNKSLLSNNKPNMSQTVDK